jgi:hypothetical protein
MVPTCPGGLRNGPSSLPRPGFDCRSAPLQRSLSFPSAQLKRGWGTLIGTGPTNKGGSVVSPRPNRTRGGSARHRRSRGAVNQEQDSVFVLDGVSRQVDSHLPPTSDGSRGQHDVVFTFYGVTWTDAQRCDMYIAGDRLLETLMSSPAVWSVVVAPYRSAPIQWARRHAGQRSTPFPNASHRVLIERRRLRRRDHTSVRALGVGVGGATETGSDR